MNKFDFYVQALQAGAYRYKGWVVEAFAVKRSTRNDEAPKLWSIRYNRDNTEGYIPTEAGDMWVPLDGTKPMEPAFYPADPITVTPEMIPNCKVAVESTYGDLLFNWFVLVEAFGNRIDFEVGPVNIGKIERIIAKRLVDDEKVKGVAPLPDQISVSMYMRYGRCMGALAGFVQVFVPTLTPKALTTDPAVRVRRAELLKENEDRLFDPVVQAKIQNELIAMDKAWIDGDPSEGFFLGSGKSFGTARKRMFLIHGPEAGFNEGGNAQLVVNSLNEGWDTDYLVDMFNSSRAGSFYRGALTALGGEAVKFFMRVFQNTTISEDDCGSKLGIERTIDPGQGEYYTGLWEIVPGGIKLIDTERAKSLEGKTILTRSPMFCRTKGPDFCAKCVGEALAAIPFAIGAENTSVASKFMDIMMASAHAKELKTAKLNITEAFT